MKLKIVHPEPTARELAGPRYWRSLDDMASTPAFKQWLDKEFPGGASLLEAVDRRNFMKIMAASFGLAGMGLAGCRQQTRHLLPYSKQPERIIPGVPIFYASSKPGPQENVPVVVETNDARPTKIEGNPSYTPIGGATDVYSQSSVLDLYDPDRAQRSSGKGGAQISLAQVSDKLGALASKYKANSGEGLYILADSSTSPVRARMAQKILQAYPRAVWAEFEPLDQANPERAATKLLGKPARPVYDFSKARRVLAIDSDFLLTEPGNLSNARGFAKARKVAKPEDADPEKMVRLYAIESGFSVTGANADHRMRCATSYMWGVAAKIAAEVLSQIDAAANSATAALLRQMAAGINVDEKWIGECAKDLVAHRGASAVIAGAQLPFEIHQLVMLMNSLLGAVGGVVTYRALPAKPAVATIADVAKAMDAGQVQTLFILNGNPVYNAPGDLNFAARLSDANKKFEVVRYGYYGPHSDETSAVADTFIAGLHYLESWGDGLTWDGVHVPVQPMIQPLFDGNGEIDVLGMLSGDPNPDAYTIVQDTFNQLHPGKSFAEWLAIGVAGSGFDMVADAPMASLRSSATSATFKADPISDSALEVRFISGAAGDGRYANNGWLQESPDPMTKLTWDNAILVSPKLGKKLGLWPEPSRMAKLGQAVMNDNEFQKGREIAKVADITVGGKTIRGPLSILPGLAENTLIVALGYGRTNAGHVGTGVGFNAYPLTSSTGGCSLTGAKLTISDTETYKLANVQEHWSIEGRAIIREGDVTEFHEDPKFVKSMDVEAHSPPIYGPAKDMSLQERSVKIPRGQELYTTPSPDKPAPNVPVWNTPEGLASYQTPQQWGMSIDLNTCLGCTACLVACQAENNIPIVGKDQVMRGREMHWIRLDRYFSSGPANGNYAATEELPDDPQVSFQSVACMHCELAPCENVCPFTATVHDDQGLNTMAYNRCVGTKYCANNCPYKVRRFNFFDWNKRLIGHFYEGPLGPQNYDFKGGEVSSTTQLTEMQKNPNVTVRMRGVMEKCTYCVQRIEAAKITQRVKARDSGDIKVADGTIRPACVQACPTESIVFGDVSDANSEVSKAKNSDRDYAALGYLDIRPRTTYLAKLRNLNPAMPGAAKQPLARLEYEARYGHGGGAEKSGAPAKAD